MNNQPFFGVIERVHADDRRAIAEISDGKFFSIQHFLVLGDELPLGNHFHREKDETFVILEGGGEVKTYSVNEDGSVAGEVIAKRVYISSVVRVPPYVVHTFRLDAGSSMICFSSKPFDQADLIPAPVKL